jgi:hypothetical protein
MKKTTHVLFITALLMMIGCSSDRSVNQDVVDAQLIEAIKSATNKEAISIDQLPSVARNVLEQAYSRSYCELAQIAPESGYEITMRRAAGGDCSEVYFDLNGRELRSGRGDGDGRDRECFYFVLPVTFIMPDGSTITVETREDWQLIRDWYTANPGIEERPALQYPVDIVFVEYRRIVTINSEEELRGAYARCGDRRGGGGRE